MDPLSRSFSGSFGSSRHQLEELNHFLRPLNVMTKALGLVRLPSDHSDTIFGWANVIVLGVTLAISSFYLPSFVQKHLRVKEYSIMSLVNCAWWSSIHVVGLVNMLVPATKKDHLEKIVFCLSKRFPGYSEDSRVGDESLGMVRRWSWLFAILAPAIYALLLFNELFCDDNPFNELESVHFLAVDFFIVSALVTESQIFLVLYITRSRFVTLNKSLRLAMGINSGQLENSSTERHGMAIPEVSLRGYKKPEAHLESMVRIPHSGAAAVFEVADFHSHLSQVANLVNKAYGVQILVTCAFRLFNLTIGLYYTLILFIGDETVKTLWLVLIQIVLWLGFYEVSIFVIVLMCEAVSKEARLTKTLVSQALIIVHDHRIRRELHLFSLQLLQTDIRFTGCEFFDVNLFLMKSMMASVVNYLVILVQFQLASKKKS